MNGGKGDVKCIGTCLNRNRILFNENTGHGENFISQPELGDAA